MIEGRKSKIGAVVLNDQGDMLLWTMRPTKSLCEEFANESFGRDVWRCLTKAGSRVIQVEIIALED